MNANFVTGLIAVRPKGSGCRTGVRSDEQAAAIATATRPLGSPACRLSPLLAQSPSPQSSPLLGPPGSRPSLLLAQLCVWSLAVRLAGTGARWKAEEGGDGLARPRRLGVHAIYRTYRHSP